MSRLGGNLGRLGRHFGSSLRPYRTIPAVLEAILESILGNLSRLGDSLGAVLGVFWAALGRSWGPLGPF